MYSTVIVISTIRAKAASGAERNIEIKRGAN